MPEYIVHYFKAHVRCDAIRAILATANADWEDKPVASFQDWLAMKETCGFPNKQMPCLELADGTKLG